MFKCICSSALNVVILLSLLCGDFFFAIALYTRRLWEKTIFKKKNALLLPKLIYLYFVVLFLLHRFTSIFLFCCCFHCMRIICGEFQQKLIPLLFYINKFFIFWLCSKYDIKIFCKLHMRKHIWCVSVAKRLKQITCSVCVCLLSFNINILCVHNILFLLRNSNNNDGKDKSRRSKDDDENKKKMEKKSKMFIGNYFTNG